MRVLVLALAALSRAEAPVRALAHHSLIAQHAARNYAAAEIVDDVLREEKTAVQRTEHFFSETLGEFGIFFVALLLGMLVACSAPYLLDFFLATCRAPRNRRYQIVKLTTGLLIFAAVYWAFALIEVPFGTVLLASSIFSLPITYALQPLLVPYFSGFWLQATTIYEEHHRIQIDDRDLVIIALGTFAIEAREYFDPAAKHGAAEDLERGERPGRRPDGGTDQAGTIYADKTVFIPNDRVLGSVVTAWWRSPRTAETPPVVRPIPVSRVQSRAKESEQQLVRRLGRQLRTVKASEV